MLTLKVSSFITHKKAESLDDCQDAIKVNEDTSRYAVADGATRSFFPKWWAELLVEHFCRKSDSFLSEEKWKEQLVPIQEEWYKRVEERVKSRNLFYLTNSLNAREPAVSTFVGLEVDKTKQEWRAIVIGDSCLFHKKGNGFKSYLIEKSEDFTSHTEALASFPEKNHYDPTFISGEFQAGDLFILATDALAKWIIQHDEANNLEGVLKQLKRIETDEQFNQFVDQERDRENIHLVNDDVTLMFITVEESQSLEVEDIHPETSSETQISEGNQSLSDDLSFLFWVILAGIFGFFVGALVLVLILLNKN